ncbi:hypothetical protein Ancab_039898 [Ancistrocladus abbreviatus]
MKINCLNTCSILSLFQFVLFSHLFLSHFKLSLALDDTLHGLGCKLLYCGQGKCIESDATIFGADCECYSGWKKIQFGPFTFPSCLIPNCYLGTDCSGLDIVVQGTSSPPAPTPPSPNSSGSHRHGLGSLYGGAILLQTLIIAWW